MERLRFYEVDFEYIEYIQKFEKKIMDSINSKSNRKFIGIVLKIDNLDYIVPLTSPKEKHKKMKNNIDFLKMDNGLLGAINFNNMFPVPKELYFEKDINLEADIKYKNLLINQISWCNVSSNKERIYRTAKKLYKEITSKKENSHFWSRCCDFILLEKIAKEYKKTN